MEKNEVNIQSVQWVPAVERVPEEGNMVPILDNVGHHRLGCFGWEEDGVTRYLDIVGTDMYRTFMVKAENFNHYAWLETITPHA